MKILNWVFGAWSPFNTHGAVYSSSKFSFELDILMVIAMVACTLGAYFVLNTFICTVLFSPDTNHMKSHLVREKTVTAFK